MEVSREEHCGRQNKGHEFGKADHGFKNGVSMAGTQDRSQTCHLVRWEGGRIQDLQTELEYLGIHLHHNEKSFHQGDYMIPFIR